MAPHEENPPLCKPLHLTSSPGGSLSLTLPGSDPSHTRKWRRTNRLHRVQHVWWGGRKGGEEERGRATGEDGKQGMWRQG